MQNSFYNNLCLNLAHIMFQIVGMIVKTVRWYKKNIFLLYLIAALLVKR